MSDRDQARQLFYQAVDLIDGEDYAPAEKLLREADRLAPNVTPVVTNLAAALFKLNRFDEAAAKAREAIALESDNPEGRLVLAGALGALQRLQESAAEYEALLAAHPDDVDGWLGLGRTLSAARRFEDALGCFDRALGLNPNSSEAWVGRGGILAHSNRHAEAVAAYSEALRLDPSAPFIPGELMFTKLHACDWRGIAADWQAISDGVAAGRPVSHAFQLLCAPLGPAEQHRAISHLAAARHPALLPPLWNGERYAHDRIRVAYVSGDFNEHPMTHLISGVFEHHDRSHFEVFGISFGPNDGSAARARIESAVERFVEMGPRSEAEIARYIRDNEIDIAVDLKGFTTDARVNIFAMRPAPVQVNYLGFPATMGAPYYDYILGDAIVTPAKHQPFFSEKIVTLPNSYMANDDKRAISDKPLSRRDADLPATGFVFCCFNNTNKITPAVFEVWMRLLSKVDHSVLWLFAANAAAPDNLRREAAKRGIAPDRLVFAPRIPAADHIARYRLADLFLDTLPYNAHTTASEALWAGLPVITAHGDTFASRVAASLLSATGLPELVKSSLADYEAAALRYAESPEALAALRAKLADLRDRAPLFDTARFTRNIESAYRTMWERAQKGQEPEGFAVAETGG